MNAKAYETSGNTVKVIETQEELKLTNLLASGLWGQYAIVDTVNRVAVCCHWQGVIVGEMGHHKNYKSLHPEAVLVELCVKNSNEVSLIQYVSRKYTYKLTSLTGEQVRVKHFV